MSGLSPLRSSAPGFIEPASDNTTFATPAEPGTPAAAAAVRGGAVASRMSVMASLDSSTPMPTTHAEVEARAAAIPRQWDAGAQRDFAAITEKLEGRVTDNETEEILEILEEQTPGQFLATLDQLRATPWKRDRSQLEKLMRRGIQDANYYIVDFAKIASEKLGFELTTQMGDYGISEGDIREARSTLLSYFDCADKADFLASVLGTLEAVAALPVALIIMAGSG